ncbi:MAG: hypothetical protein ACPL1F_07705 [bacterium]
MIKMLGIKNNLFKANEDKAMKGETILTGAAIGVGVGAIGVFIMDLTKLIMKLKKYLLRA